MFIDPVSFPTGEMSSPSFHDLLRQLSDGDSDGAAELVERYASRLRALAYRKMGAAIRQKIDPEDVVQSVFRSFFARQSRGDLTVEGWDNVWTLLALMTARKCANQGKHFHRERRNVFREVSINVGSKAAVECWIPTDEPTPEEAAILVETLTRLLDSLDERERLITERRLQGLTVEEISEDVDYSERTVRRVLQHVRSRLEDSFNDTNAPTD